MSILPRYVLITPARNEAEFIELTIKSVVGQTHLPLKWVIVSDGSTDSTDDIVMRYAAEHTWIELLRMPERRERNFAGKAHAVKAGYDRIRGLQFDVVGSLDGDISFDQDYFPLLLQKLAEHQSLGVIGTPFKDSSNRTYDYRFVNIEHVTGCCQVFRRQCFEDIGGYMAVKGGSVDTIAVISARMKGWKTRTFTDTAYLHHRSFGTAQTSALMASFRQGVKDHAIGNHPVWEVFRTVYQATRKPIIAGSIMLASGYLWATLRRMERPVSTELMKFNRREQMERLRRFLTGRTMFRTPSLGRS